MSLYACLHRRIKMQQCFFLPTTVYVLCSLMYRHCYRCRLGFASNSLYTCRWTTQAFGTDLLTERAAANVHINAQKQGRTGKHDPAPVKSRARPQKRSMLKAWFLCRKRAFPIYLLHHQTSQERPGNSCERLLWGSPGSILRVQMNEGTREKSEKNR